MNKEGTDLCSWRLWEAGLPTGGPWLRDPLWPIWNRFHLAWAVHHSLSNASMVVVLPVTCRFVYLLLLVLLRFLFRCRWPTPSRVFTRQAELGKMDVADARIIDPQARYDLIAPSEKTDLCHAPIRERIAIKANQWIGEYVEL